MQRTRLFGLKRLRTGSDSGRPCAFLEIRIYWRPVATARGTETLKIIRTKWPPIELLIQPTQDANLGRTQRLDPAIDEKFHAHTLGRDLLRLVYYRTRRAHVETVG